MNQVRIFWDLHFLCGDMTCFTIQVYVAPESLQPLTIPPDQLSISTAFVAHTPFPGAVHDALHEA